MKGWLRTQSHFDPQEEAWLPNFHGAAQAGFSTIVSHGQGQPWLGVVCAPAASWDTWGSQGSTAVFRDIEAVVAEAVRLGGTEQAARWADVWCAEDGA